MAFTSADIVAPIGTTALSRLLAEAHTVLADAYVQSKEVEAARTEAERALALDPSSSEAKRLLDMLKSP